MKTFEAVWDSKHTDILLLKKGDVFDGAWEVTNIVEGKLVEVSPCSSDKKIHLRQSPDYELFVAGVRSAKVNKVIFHGHIYIESKDFNGHNLVFCTYYTFEIHCINLENISLKRMTNPPTFVPLSGSCEIITPHRATFENVFMDVSILRVKKCKFPEFKGKNKVVCGELKFPDIDIPLIKLEKQGLEALGLSKRSLKSIDVDEFKVTKTDYSGSGVSREDLIIYKKEGWKIDLKNIA